MPGYAVVQRCDTITDRCVQLDEREEPDVAQLGDNPARRDLHGDLDLRLVARFSRPCRHDGRVVVHRHFGIGDRKSTRLNSSHLVISYAVFCLKKKIIKYVRFSVVKKKKCTSLT